MNAMFRCAALLILIPSLLVARPDSENQRIEYLLATIENLTGAVFVRSGADYDGKAAEAHLRMKLGKAGERVKTAEQFIEGVASKSYLTGKPYQVRFADGKVVNAADFLTSKLNDFDSRPSSRR